MNVAWSMRRGERWKVRVNTFSLPNDFADLEEAKTAAIKLARELLEEAREALKETP